MHETFQVTKRTLWVATCPVCGDKCTTLEERREFWFRCHERWSPYVPETWTGQSRIG